MKFVINFLFILSLLITTQSLSDSFKPKRAEAIKDYNNGKINLAFKKLKSLVQEGDSEAARDMGILLIKGKRRDIDEAFYWLEVSAKMCNSRSLEFLKSQYNKRGGLYFKPAKIEYIKSKCANYKKINKKFAEKSKIKNLDEKPEKKKIAEQPKIKNLDEKPEKKIVAEQPKIKNLDQKPEKNIVAEQPEKIKPNKNKFTKEISINDQQKSYFVSENVKNSWKKISPLKSNLKYSGWGSAFAISREGHFLTNHHVIENCSGVNILYNKMYGSAKILAINKKMDSAILKVDALTPFYLKFDTNNHKLGEDLYAAGYPMTTDLILKKATDNITLSKGILANTEIIRSNFLLISVPIASGNSGGPVLGKYGLIRGQITAGFNVDKMVKNFDKFIQNKTGSNSSQTLQTNITMNLMISSIKLKNWINSTNIIFQYDGKKENKLDSDEIGEIATHTVSAVSCFK